MRFNAVFGKPKAAEAARHKQLTETLGKVLVSKDMIPAEELAALSLEDLQSLRDRTERAQYDILQGGPLPNSMYEEHALRLATLDAALEARKK